MTASTRMQCLYNIKVHYAAVLQFCQQNYSLFRAHHCSLPVRTLALWTQKKKDSEVSLNGILFIMSGRCGDHYDPHFIIQPCKSVCNTALIYSEIIRINVLFFTEDDFLSWCMESSRSCQGEVFISKEVREGQAWIFMATLM